MLGHRRGQPISRQMGLALLVGVVISVGVVVTGVVWFAPQLRIH